MTNKYIKALSEAKPVLRTSAEPQAEAKADDELLTALASYINDRLMARRVKRDNK